MCLQKLFVGDKKVMKILLLDRNKDYSERFKYYLEKKFNLEIFVCDNINDFSNSLGLMSFDVILCDTSYEYDLPDNVFDISAFAFLSETNEVVGNTDTIFRYQSITNLNKEICSCYEKKKNRIVKKNTDDVKPIEYNTNIITFLPIHGGAGSSTMAAACAVILSQENEVLYINMEQLPSDFAFFESEGTKNNKSLSDILVHMKTKYSIQSLTNEFTCAIKKDKKYGTGHLYYIQGLKNIMDDVETLNGKIVKEIINTLKHQFHYRYVIIDGYFVVNDYLKELIFNSDKLVFVSSDSDIARQKFSKIKRYIKILSRNPDENLPQFYMLFNQYYGNMDFSSEVDNMQILGSFPRYRTNDQTRILTYRIIDEIRNKKEVFDKL